jgi:uncharacterized protein YabE (DUF348 family)
MPASEKEGGRLFRSPTFKLVLAALVLVFACSSYAVMHKEVTIADGDDKITVSTFAHNVDDLLKQQEIHLGPHDAVEPGTDAPLKEGCTVRILRAFTVTVAADGRKETIETQKKKVKEILQEAKIEVAEQDIVKPGLDAVVDGETEIRIQRVSFKEVVEDKKIPYKTIREKDRTLYKGTQRVRQEGKNGIERNIYRVTFVDGKEKERKLLKKFIHQEPQAKVVAEGTLQVASRGGRDFTFDRVLRVEASAYTYTGRNTYSGTKPGPGTIAVDPRVIPLGTRLYVDGYGYGVARDVGSAIVGNKIDVFLESEAAARRWGRRMVNVYFLN